NLEAGRTLRRRIHRLVSEDDCRPWCDDFLCLSRELSGKRALLRCQEETLAGAIFSCGGYFHPTQMSLWIQPAQRAEDAIVQGRNNLGIRNSRATDLHAVAINVDGFIRAADNQGYGAAGRFARGPFKLTRGDRLALIATLCKE